MKRTKQSNKLAPIVKDFLRVGMWPISRTVDSETGIVRRAYKYGSGKNAGRVIVHGELREQDRGAFLIIRAMDKSNGYEGIHGKVPDLIKMKGVKNIYNPLAVNPMWDSVENLLNVDVRIKPNIRGGSLSLAFKLVTGWVDSGGEFFLITHDYQKIVESLGLYELNIPLDEYFVIKSPITRSLREYLRTQTLPFGGKGYELSLANLCKYIGYNPTGLSWSGIWQHIEKSITELVERGILSKRCKRDINRMKDQGGVVMFWEVKKQIVKEETIGTKNDKLLQAIKEAFPGEKMKGTENAFRSALNKTSRTKQYNGRFDRYLKDYLEWLGDHVKWVSAVLFLNDNSYFKEFEAIYEDNHQPANDWHHPNWMVK